MNPDQSTAKPVHTAEQPDSVSSGGRASGEDLQAALPADDERVEVELRAPTWMAELHREIGDAGINAILRLQLKRGLASSTGADAALMQRAAKALRGALNEAARHICMHEDTHRGGAIWEICDWCGAKWADDEGGKPEYMEPKAITEGYAVLALLVASGAATGDQS